MRSTTCTPSLAPAAEVGHTPYEIVRFNALKHGILSRYTVLSHENHADYESLGDSPMHSLSDSAEIVNRLLGNLSKPHCSTQSPLHLS